MIRRFCTALISSLLLVSCGDTTMAGNEGGSSIEVVGIVTGTAVRDGAHPVENGRAKLVYRNRRGVVSYDHTEKNGFFQLPLNDIGPLGVVLYDSLKNGYYASLNVEDPSLHISLDTVLLEAMGSVTGTIDCSNLIQWEQMMFYPEDFRVIISETGEEFPIDPAGKFTVPAIPAGTYTLVISPRLLGGIGFQDPQYSDTVITVKTGEKISLPTLMIQSEPLTVNDPLFSKDSAVVQEILDLNGITEPVLKLSRLKRNRISSLKLRGIDTIPVSIGKLEKLIDLTVIGGDITSLPTEISGCSDLQSIVVNYTKLNTLPAELTALKELFTLDLQNNSFEKIPEFLMELESTPEIDLRYNAISPSEKEQKWLLANCFYNDSIRLAEWKATQSTDGN